MDTVSSGPPISQMIKQKNYHSAEILQTALDLAVYAYCLLDREGYLLDVNQTACETFGYTREEMLGLHIVELSPSVDVDLPHLFLDHTPKNDGQPQETIFRHKSGDHVPVELKINETRIDDEICLIVYVRDISRRKETNKDLRLTKFAVDHAANATFWYKANNPRFFYVNDAACEYLGYSRDELLGMSVSDINPQMTQDVLQKHIERLRRLPSAVLEGEHQKKNGDMVPIEALVKLIEYDGEEYIISFVRDVSSHLETERQLKLAKEKAERADRIKSEFLANMSHEIRTPLTGIIGFSEELKNPDLSDIERNEMVDVIINSSQHLGIIINDILDLSKIEAHQLKIENVAVSPIEMFAEIEALMSRRASEKGLTFYSDISYPLPKTILTDPVRLKQILLNICSNAIKFTDKGEIRFGIQYSAATRQLHFSVKDTGIGMTEAEIKTIFKPFSQADASTTRRYGGTGLGLSISSELAKMLGGDIQVQSEKGVGTTFTLSTSIGVISHVELEYSHNLPGKNKSTSIDPQQVKFTGKVLLVEDMDENQRLIAMYLRRTGVDVEIVDDGRKAIDLATHRNFDLILMDSQMPVIGGLDAIRQLRGQGYKKPIVSITANAMAQDKQICLDAGADDYLKKPLELPDFFRVLNQYLQDQNTGGFQVYEENDPELDEMRKLFAQAMPDYLSQLKIHSEEKDWQKLAIVLHKLKGIGGSFGYPAISRFAADLEEKLLAKDYSTTINGVSGLIQMCEAILATLE